MSVELGTEGRAATPSALWRVDLPGLYRVDDLHGLVKRVVFSYAHPRISVRALHIVHGNQVSLGWETCQAGLNMILTPTIDTRRFDTDGKHDEIFVKPISSAQPEKRRCSCHGLPDGTIDELREQFLVLIHPSRVSKLS